MFPNAVKFTLMYNVCKGSSLYLHLKMLPRKKNTLKHMPVFPSSNKKDEE